MRRFLSRLLTTLGLIWISVVPAFADATAFLGISTSPSTRHTVGFAVGSGLLVIGFEFEYARISEDQEEFAPEVTSYMGNLLVQTPVPIHGIQFYGTAGAGPYHVTFEEEFANANRVLDSDWRFGSNVGGGVKITLAGPLRLRLDYRVLLFKGSFFPESPKRFYAGVNLAF
jgi:opacity protein-like surface antigen